MADESSTDTPIKTECDFVVLGGENMPNHSESLAGRGKFIRINGYSPQNALPIMRTRQSAFRLAAWVVRAAEEYGLPDEPGEHEFDEIFDAIVGGETDDE